MQKVWFESQCIEVDDAVFQQFCGKFRELPAAGGLVRNQDGEFLMIRRRGLWDLPKGHQEDGEAIEDCALREVSEETGLSGLKLGRLICITHHTYRLNGAPCLKHTWWYEMDASCGGNLIPQQEEDITEVEWVKKECLPEHLEGTYGSIAEVFANAGL